MSANMHEDFESILENYPVRLENFEGPLDLLLHLIKRHEVSIYDIPITSITKQYLEYIDLMTELNLDVAGEFLVMAATLIHIKSRLLLPRADPAQEDPEEDPREALVRRLLEHQKFKAAAELLHERETLRSAQWTRPDGPIAEIAGEAPEPEVEVDLFSLISAFRNVVERAKQRPKVYLPSEQIPIEDRIEQLMARLSETEACGFEDLFSDVESRAGLIVTFLAMLEMIRLKLVRVFQSGVVGPIRIYKRARPADAPKPLGDPEQKHADIVRLADEVAQAMADEARATAEEFRAAAAEEPENPDRGSEEPDR
jgi:segregation and condensation protein A